MSKMKPFNYRQSELASPFGIFQSAISQYLGGRLALLQPVEIVSTDGTYATVKPLLAHFDTLGQKIPIDSNSYIPNVPIVQPFGANGQFQFKPQAGDKGLLIACNWDTTNYKATHDETTVASNRQFNWSDGFFIPVDFQAAPTGALIKNGSSSIALEKNEINVSTGTANVTATTNINGDTSITGETTITGATNITGDVTINGTLTVTGGITTPSTVTASGGVTSGTIAFATHTHGVTKATGTGTPAPTPDGWPTSGPIGV